MLSPVVPGNEVEVITDAPTAVAIGPWTLRRLQALVSDMKKGVFVLWFTKS